MKVQTVTQIMREFGCTRAEAEAIRAEDLATAEQFATGEAKRTFDAFCNANEVDMCVAMENAGVRNDGSFAFWNAAINAAKITLETR